MQVKMFQAVVNTEIFFSNKTLYGNVNPIFYVLEVGEVQSYNPESNF